MNINEQTKQAKEFTDKLLKYVEGHNKKMNKDGRGCYLTHVNIIYRPDQTTIETSFESSNNLEAPVKSFDCISYTYY